ncbi:MAG: MBL fold metallo-hydrolase [Chloroflexia bacterium]|nr:MBL fold metallo-hydrolase [Chloroflexia bacterium]
MTIHFLNCFTCNARVPSDLRTGTLCLLIESDRGLVLVDTGLGREDYVHKTAMVRIFQLVTVVPLDPREAAVRQVTGLGYHPGDVRHIVLTHMHFDHCGGLPDFPQARVHVHRRELEAFEGCPRRWTDLAYVRRHVAHRPEFALYEHTGEGWFGLEAIRLPFEPEMWLVPLFGHTRGHCGVAVKGESGWLFHVGDAAPADLDDSLPAWLVRFVLGPHAPRLRAFRAAHPEIRMTTGHMPSCFFSAPPPAPAAGALG